MTGKEALELAILEYEKDLEKDEDNQWVEDVLEGLKECQRNLENAQDMLTLYKAATYGFYYKENNEIKYNSMGAVIVGKYMVKTTPIYAVKEVTLNSCYFSDVEPMKEVHDAHYWSWETCKYWEIKDYGKTWALTREELENDR